MLQIKKIHDGVFKHIENGNNFIITKFYAKSDNNNFLIVEVYGSKRREFNYSEIEVFNISGSAETFGSIEELFIRLKEIGYTGYYEDGIYIFEPNAWISTDAGNILVLGADGLYYVPSGGGGSQDLQSVLDNGDTATNQNGNFIDLSNNIEIVGDSVVIGTSSIDNEKGANIGVSNFGSGVEPYINLLNNDTGGELIARIDNLTGVTNVQFGVGGGIVAYEENQNFIPLSGTEVGSPLTGDIDINIGGIGSKLGYQPSNDSIGLFNQSLYKSVGGEGFVFNNGVIPIMSIDFSNALGLNATKDFSANYGDLTYAQVVWINGFNVASSEVNFKRNSIYGTFTTPITTNVTVDLTGASSGKVQKMYHQSGTVPTFPAGFVKINGTYSTTRKNNIYFDFSEGTRVEYWIVNL